VCEWLSGEGANGTIDDLSHAAVDLAAFVIALRQVDTTGAPPRSPHGRGGPLEEFDQQVRRSIAQLGVRIDGQSRLRFRTELRVDDASWSRSRGWAL
jgi:aminoglycoside phosphotransferase (APT) family kinase protein